MKLSDIGFDHPYKEFEGKRLWAVIDEAVEDLVDNRDIMETTHRNYIVGYLCKKIEEGGLTEGEVARD